MLTSASLVMIVVLLVLSASLCSSCGRVRSVRCSGALSSHVTLVTENIIGLCMLPQWTRVSRFVSVSVGF